MDSPGVERPVLLQQAGRADSGVLGHAEVVHLDVVPGPEAPGGSRARVRLLAGPFAEQIGVLERLGGQGRVRVLLEMMGSAVPVTSTADQLLPA